MQIQPLTEAIPEASMDRRQGASIAETKIVIDLLNTLSQHEHQPLALRLSAIERVLRIGRAEMMESNESDVPTLEEVVDDALQAHDWAAIRRLLPKIASAPLIESADLSNRCIAEMGNVFPWTAWQFALETASKAEDAHA